MPAPKNPLKAALGAGHVQIGLWLGLAHPVVAEIAGQSGFDWCLIDAEHGPNTLSTIQAQILALAGTAASPVVRVPIGQDWMIKQVLDLGAQTILVPMVTSAAEAEALVRAMRYPPDGVRGVGASLARASRYGTIPDYVRSANAETCLIVQAESVAAMEAIDEIAAVDGVDAVFIGPADLAADMGFPGQIDAAPVVHAIEAGIRHVRAAGKAAGCLTFDRAGILHYAQLGVGFLGVGGDVTSLSRALTDLAEDTHSVLKHFD